LEGTTGWLSRPSEWEDNQGDPGFSDRRLAQLQFTLALAVAKGTGLEVPPAALPKALAGLAAEQADDGSWPIGDVDTLGSPATYGNALATALALGVLRAHGDKEAYEESIRRAEGWWRDRPPRSMVEAAAWLLTWPQPPPRPWRRSWDLSHHWILTGQTADGGWGPYADAPPEPFDTALVVLALCGAQRLGAVWPEGMISRGRAFLVDAQRADGSWPETTRPARGRSFAQRLSTSGWATLALLATEPVGPGPSNQGSVP
jgi:hypothetical protein